MCDTAKPALTPCLENIFGERYAQSLWLMAKSQPDILRQELFPFFLCLQALTSHLGEFHLLPFTSPPQGKSHIAAPLEKKDSPKKEAGFPVLFRIVMTWVYSWRFIFIPCIPSTFSFQISMASFESFSHPCSKLKAGHSIVSVLANEQWLFFEYKSQWKPKKFLVMPRNSLETPISTSFTVLKRQEFLPDCISSLNQGRFNKLFKMTHHLPSLGMKSSIFTS